MKIHKILKIQKIVKIHKTLTLEPAISTRYRIERVMYRGRCAGNAAKGLLKSYCCFLFAHLFCSNKSNS